MKPSTDGYLGAWLVAGPVQQAPTVSRNQRIEEGAPSHEASWAPRWRLASHSDGALDLASFLRAEAGAHALVGGVLSVQATVDAYLLVGVDGDVDAYLDGTRAWTRHGRRLRGESWDVIPLHLEAGEHSLVLRLKHRGRYWAFACRLLAQSDLLPPAGVLLRLPGTDDHDAETLVRTLLSSELRVEVEPGGLRPAVALEYRRGAPASRPLHLAFSGDTGSFLGLGEVPLGKHGVAAFTARLPRLTGGDAARRETLKVRVAETERRFAIAWSPEAHDAAGATLATLESIGGSHSAVAKATLQGHLRQLAASAAQGDLPAVIERAKTLAAAAQRTTDDSLLPADGGVVELWHRSRLDGSLQSFLVHVPKRHGRQPDASAPAPDSPLVVALHGYNGSPSGILQAFIGRGPGDPPHPRVRGFVVAPQAFGNAFYRGPGEIDVLEVLDWVVDHASVDAERISITGVSMGGTGAAHLALRYPDRFSAAAPLAGYQSYFVRRDTSNRRLRPWERARMQHWSPASWAENGQHQLLYVAHGLQDKPLVNSRVLTDRYEQLGYRVVSEWPDTGHSVWRVAYANARLWPRLSAEQRQRAPSEITLVTDQLRYGRRAWITLLSILPGTLARVSARSAAGEVVLQTDGVLAIQLNEPLPGHEPGSRSVVIDGDRLQLPESDTHQLARVSGHWQQGLPAPPARRPGAEGAIREVFLEPVLFVYGAREARYTRANREMAEHFAYRYGGDARYPIVADTAARATLDEDSNLFLVGTERTNDLVRQLGSQVPIRTTATAVRAGGRQFSGEETGALFIYPNPRRAGRSVVVLTSPSVAGILRAASLPKLLPEFVVYDAHVVPATAEQVLGNDADVPFAGFFRNDWSLPPASETADGAAPVPSDSGVAASPPEP